MDKTKADLIMDGLVVDGIGVTYLIVNQAYLVTWHNQTLRLINSRIDTIAYVKYLTNEE